MKTKMRVFILLPFFALLFFTSCQNEVIDITEPNEAQALVANSELTSLIGSTSKMDGSKDNIIDKASCLSIELPVTVVVNGLEIIIDSEEDYKVIKAIFDEFEDDNDHLEIVFPITIVMADHSEIVIEDRLAFEELIAACREENEPDDDIECIDFQYPISFSVYNTEFQIIDVVTIENDRQLYRFIHRVKEGEVFASLNFPVTMALADNSTKVVEDNLQLQNTIKEAKDACDEDDDNDFHDNDFSKERLDNLLKTCPWVVYEFNRNEENLNDQYREYVMVFKEDNVVKVHARGGDIITGTWTTRITDRGALVKLEFDTLVDFKLEWFVYDIEYGRIKLYQEGGNRIILKKNCDIALNFTKEKIENYLQQCFWRLARLSVDGIDNEKDYIGTPLKFFPNNEVKIRVNGELVAGTYEVLARNTGFILQINLEGRPNLKLEWLITFLEPGLIKLENGNNKMILERHCPEADGDINYIGDVIVTGEWKVTKYFIVEGEMNKTENYNMYTINFLASGAIAVTDPNNGLIDGSWLAYRKEGLNLGLQFGIEQPFAVLNHRWKIVDIEANIIELHDLDASNAVKRILIIEKQI